MSARMLIGDCLDKLRELPDESVHCCITSPPYYGLRDYGTATWEGGDPECDHVKNRDPLPAPFDGGAIRTGDIQYRGTCQKCGAVSQDNQIGLELTPEEHIAKLVEVFREVRRVLRKDATLFMNYGDAYASTVNGRSAADTKAAGNDDRTFRDKPYSTVGNGYKPKDLLMMPARVALALQQDGWWLRSMMPWVKRSAMPESVTDRPATAIEYVFLLAKSPRYYFDMEAVRQAHNDQAPFSRFGSIGKQGGYQGGIAKGDDDHARPSFALKPGGRTYNPAGRNFRNSDLFYASLEPPHGLICGDEPLALDVNPAAFSSAHFATFPPKLVEPLIKAATSEKGVCAECGAPWVREVGHITTPDASQRWGPRGDGNRDADKRTDLPEGSRRIAKTLGWSPSCAHNAAVVPATVLDPFGGAGTVGLVADRLKRNSILIELNPEYADMARRRISGDAPLFAEVSA